MKTISKKLTLIDFILPKLEGKVLILIKDLLLVLGFTILTALCAKIKIEIGPVPITGQTFAVLLSGVFLGSIRGGYSQLFYLLGGLAGIPWFARGGGIAYLLQPTFGYLIGFVFAAFIIGYLAEKGWDRNFIRCALIMILGNIIIYFFGLLWLGRFTGYANVLAKGFYPFIIGDLLKIILAIIVLSSLWKWKSSKVS